MNQTWPWNEDFMSLAGLHKSLSNSFVFGGDTFGRLLGAVHRKKPIKLLERSCCKRQRQFKNNSLHWSRGCGPRLQAIDMATPNVLFHANALRLSKSVSETRKREREEQGNQGTMTALVTVQITYRKSSIKPPGGLFCFKTINWSGGGGGGGLIETEGLFERGLI